MIASLRALEVTEEAESLTQAILSSGVMPANAIRDPAHIAVATVHRIDYLLTWNCRHLANANKTAHIRRVNALLGLHTPLLVTPLELLEQDCES